jgi:hypothetical protein
MDELMAVLPALFAAGAAYGAARQGMVGISSSLDDLNKTIEKMRKRVDWHAERIAALETHKQHLQESIRNVEKRNLR